MSVKVISPQTKGGADRQTFDVRSRRGWGYRRFQVFGFGKGFLMLDLGPVEAPGHSTGSVIGGLLGGAIGSAIGSSIGESMNSGGFKFDYSGKSDEQLLQLARERKHSVVAPYDDIQSAVVEVPTMFGRIGYPGSLAGLVTFREKSLGKIVLEVHDAMSMAAAIEAVPRRLPDRATVNARFDEFNCTFVREH